MVNNLEGFKIATEVFQCRRCGSDYESFRLTADFEDKSVRGKILNCYFCDDCRKKIDESMDADFKKILVSMRSNA